MYRQYPFSEQKQQEAKVKVKETDTTYSQIWLFPVTNCCNMKKCEENITVKNYTGGGQ